MTKTGKGEVSTLEVVTTTATKTTKTMSTITTKKQ